MAELAPSLNIVTLTGVLHAAARRATGPEGHSTVELEVVTGADGRSVRHRVRVVDPELAGTVFHAPAGAPVAVVGELDYDSSGAFVAVLARRSCDVRIGSATVASAASAPQAATTERAPVSSSFAPVEPAPQQKPAQARVEAPKVQPQRSGDELVERIEPQAAAIKEAAVEPAVADPVVESASEPSPAPKPEPVKANGFSKGGFGGFGSGSAGSTSSQPSPSKPASSFGGLKSLGSSPTTQPEDYEEVPKEERPTRSSGEGSRPSFTPTPFGRSSGSAPIIGPDDKDDDIPF